MQLYVYHQFAYVLDIIAMYTHKYMLFDGCRMVSAPFEPYN